MNILGARHCGAASRLIKDEKATLKRGIQGVRDENPRHSENAPSIDQAAAILQKRICVA
jgi:hypothetical protein